MMLRYSFQARNAERHDLWRPCRITSQSLIFLPGDEGAISRGPLFSFSSASRRSAESLDKKRKGKKKEGRDFSRPSTCFVRKKDY